MKTTKALKAMVMGCLVIVCMHGYAVANENAPVANLDNGAAYVTDAQDAEETNQDVELNTAENGLGMKTIGACILTCAVAPWGTVSVAIMSASGLGAFYDALVPERNDKPENTRVVVLADKD